MQEFTHPRLDAFDKVTGRAKYADDLSFPNMLHAATVHCPHAHAEILSIDASDALAMEGVVGVYLAKDCTGALCNPHDKPVLVERFARCVGDGVALVAAETEAVARQAAKLVKVSYRELPAVFDVVKAAASNEILVHHDTTDSNIFYTHAVEKGDVSVGFSDADIVIENTFSTPRHHHGAIETDAVVTIPDDGKLTVYCSCKGAFAMREAIAKNTGLPSENIRLIHSAIGGTFGGKQDDTVVLAGRAAMVSLHTGRPCKIVWSREETLTEGSKRHPFVVTYKIGAKSDGHIVAMQVTGFADAGAYRSKSPNVVKRAAIECSGPYAIPNVSIDLKAVLTNNVYCDAVRGFGSPQVYFGLESSMNILADKLGMDPLALRKLNALHEGDIYATGQKLKCVGIRACLDKLEEIFPCEPLHGKIVGDKAYGRGIACQIRGESHGGGAKDACGVDLIISEDGTITMNTGVTEMGQGTHTGLALVAMDLLGLNDWSRFRAGTVDTAVVPFATPTTASRGTISGANATYLAAQDLIKNLSKVIASAKEVPEETVLFRNGRFYYAGGGEQLTFDEAAALSFAQGIEPRGCGRWTAPKTNWDYEKKQGNAFYSYSYGAAGAEVEVDLVTGKIEVLNLTCLHDAGRIVNYAGAKGQIEGGIVMALGHCTSEELAVSEGHVKTENFNTYLMPTSLDIHQLIGQPVALVPNDTPMGVHGVAEGSTVLTAAVIANAVEDALGVRIHDLPLSLERVRAAIEKAGIHCDREEDVQ